MNLRLILQSVFVLASFPCAAVAELTIASPFSNYAVLQRDSSVPVWGRAEAGTSVAVDFAGQTKSAKTDESGRWSLKLDPMAASNQPRQLSIVSGGDRIDFTNVLVGEVWICSGQSNMQMGVDAVPDVKALLPATKQIRCFEVKRTVSLTEQESCEGSWTVQHPSSAVAFAFAHFLRE